ncbi:MAG: hypothetical protein ACTH4Y_03760 [Microbacterium gubbeenense]|uniref:hypothetical protein n=1 Tax=Microbacterium gubbeenense TaxID=159896 RepID=UPI003F9943B6
MPKHLDPNEIPRFTPRDHPQQSRQQPSMAEQYQEPKSDWRQAPRRIGKLGLLIFGYTVQSTVLLLILGAVVLFGFVLFGGGGNG